MMKSRFTNPSVLCFLDADLTVTIQVDDNKARLLNNWLATAGFGMPTLFTEKYGNASMGNNGN